MSIPKKKLKSGLSLDSLAFGTWKMGGGRSVDTRHDEKEVKAIRKAYELGMRRFDTAELYGDGHAEELLATALSGVLREELFITSKVMGSNLGYQQVLDACEASLRRLNMDYLDLYLLHWKSDNVSIKETMKAMDELIEKGKIKNIGISNYSTRSTNEAQAATMNKIILNQVHYNLAFREPEHEGLLKYCQENDIFLEAWRPLQLGELINSNEGILQDMVAKYSRTPAQIAINWLISQDNVLTLFKASNVAHIEEDLGAVGWSLEDEDIERLRSEFTDQRRISDAVPLE